MVDFGHMADENPEWRQPYDWEPDDSVIECWYCGRKRHVSALQFGLCPDCTNKGRALEIKYGRQKARELRKTVRRYW